MRTTFSIAQLANSDIQESNQILRRCVHCGFCLATCPTHVLLGDELDSPRGRIYLIKEMLEADKPPSPETVKHLDRCLGCASCMTTCPSDVNYVRLLEHGRAHVARTHSRTMADRISRWFFANLLARPSAFRVAVRLAAWFRPLSSWLPRRMRAAVALAPRRLPPTSLLDRQAIHPVHGKRRARVALLTGCVQRVLAPNINDATVRLLNRHGVEVVVAGGGCCGALAHHMGRTRQARKAARANVAAWWCESRNDSFDAVIVNASGCGMAVKDYGHLLRGDSVWSEQAAKFSGVTKDVAEYLNELGLESSVNGAGTVVAYQPSCALLHGQSVKSQPEELLINAGFTVKPIPEAHLCCGSAGTYNFFEPEIAEQLRARKAKHVGKVNAEFIATSNIGCMVQLAGTTNMPVRHLVEMLDWATGGPHPTAGGKTTGRGRRVVSPQDIC